MRTRPRPARVVALRSLRTTVARVAVARTGRARSRPDAPPKPDESGVGGRAHVGAGRARVDETRQAEHVLPRAQFTRVAGAGFVDHPRARRWCDPEVRHRMVFVIP